MMFREVHFGLCFVVGFFCTILNGIISIRELIKVKSRNKLALLFFLNNTCSLGRRFSCIVNLQSVTNNATCIKKLSKQQTLVNHNKQTIPRLARNP